jgi:negative regulator of sigma E activity
MSGQDSEVHIMQALHEWRDALGLLSVAMAIVAAIIYSFKPYMARSDPIHCHGSCSGF